MYFLKIRPVQKANNEKKKEEKKNAQRKFGCTKIPKPARKFRIRIGKGD